MRQVVSTILTECGGESQRLAFMLGMLGAWGSCVAFAFALGLAKWRANR
jgi:hypothetical protein